ncbi:MAG: NYN domain-containing protein [Planctomycetes bacterium]|nr:NYN domain-containing protein [Planctomycetota bacterium]
MTSYLIDGYNLLFALGILQGRTGPLGLEKARRRLLGWLRGVYGEEAPAVTVVFDAAHPQAGQEDVLNYQGIQVRFAVNYPAADDLIEALIRQDSAPRQLTVVSNDHRLQQAARRRQCVVMGCADFLEELERRRRQKQRRPPKEAEKREVASEEEAQAWLHEFADLADDPQLKELFDPFSFRKNESTIERGDEPAEGP